MLGQAVYADTQPSQFKTRINEREAERSQALFYYNTMNPTNGCSLIHYDTDATRRLGNRCHLISVSHSRQPIPRSCLYADAHF